MKVAMYYTRPFETGGVEKAMYNRGKLLSKLGYEITYIYNCKDCPLDTLELWSKVGNVKRLDNIDPYYDFVIYDATYNLPYIESGKKVQVFNGNLIDGKETYTVDFNIDEYIAVSEECAKQVKEKCNINCKIIPNIIDIEEIQSKMLEKCDIPIKKHTFLVVARFDANKGYHKLESFIKEVDSKYKNDYQFIFVGSNNLYPKYYEMIKQKYQSYNIIYAGKQDNPYKFMYNADTVLIPSISESQCLVLDEALICGTPVVSTDFEVAKTKINKENGILVDKEFNNYDLEAILKLKKGFEYKYTNLDKKWLELLKPYEKKNIKFSIIIPNYNNEQWLEKCLNSVLNQTYKNYEVIFVDDMSTDNSLKIANRLLKEHKVIPLKQKRLNGGARNVGIIEATGDYILCLDSDDWFKNNKVLEMLNNRIKNEDVIFTGFDLYNGEQEGLYPFVPEYKNLFEAFKSNVCAIWTKVVKAEILKETLFPEGTLAEDRVHHDRVIDKCKSFICIKESTHVWNRANKTSTTTLRTIEWDASCIKHLAEMYKFIKTTKNEQYRKEVEAKYNKQLENIKRGIFSQL